MYELYPLRFRPTFRQYLWGGRRLETVLGKSLGECDDYAESWEVVDHGADQSVVAEGPLEGTTLRELVRRQGRELFGCHAPQDQFPLLFKFLDAHRSLSVQVHPNDAQAAQLEPPDLGKTEAWVILHADPGSVIYAGLKRGVDRAMLEREVHRGTTHQCLHQFEPKPGDCVFVPAGTVHALGAGLVVAEIQQASDATFRLFDWNRLGPDGKPRPLHVEQALDAVDYDRGPVSPQVVQSSGLEGLERLVICDQFILDRWHLTQMGAVGGDQRFHVLAVLEGAISIERDVSEQPVRKGQTVLLPAAAGLRHLEPDGEALILDMYLPYGSAEQ